MYNKALIVSDNPDQINGQWVPWTGWSNCPVTCGESTQQRTRLCNNPKAENGGAECSAEVLDGIETRPCNKSPCPGS